MQDTQNQSAPPVKALRLEIGPAAAYLGVPPRLLKQYRHERKIPFYRIGYRKIVFDVRDLDAFLARKRVESIEGVRQ